MEKDFIGRHVLVDVATFNSNNMTDVSAIYNLLEALSISLKMTLIHPPIVARIPFASHELYRYTNLLIEDGIKSHVVEDMKYALDLQKNNKSGISGTTMWLESHASIHTWPERNFFSFDAYSCKDFDPNIVFDVLNTLFDMKKVNGLDIIRYANSQPVINNIELSY